MQLRLDTFLPQTHHDFTSKIAIQYSGRLLLAQSRRTFKQVRHAAAEFMQQELTGKLTRIPVHVTYIPRMMIRLQN
jgi:hypothetical protein